MSAKGLHAKLAEVMAEVGRIPKNGTAPASMGAFRFVEAGDAADTIRKALGERGVSMLPSGVEIVGEAEHATSSGKSMTTLTVRTTWTLVDGETQQTATIQSLGAGADTGDKAAPKAQTNAMKYALLMGFLLSTGDDPETVDTSDRQARTRTSRTPAGDSSSTGGGDTEPILVPLGRESHTGRATKGTSSVPGVNDLVYVQTPDGHRIGFRLELPDGKAVPQVICGGALGEALFVTVPEDELDGATVTVEGTAYRVEQAGRRPYRRLVVERIKGPDFEIPAPQSALPPSPVSVAPSASGGEFDDLPF